MNSDLQRMCQALLLQACTRCSRPDAILQHRRQADSETLVGQRTCAAGASSWPAASSASARRMIASTSLSRSTPTLAPRWLMRNASALCALAGHKSVRVRFQLACKHLVHAVPASIAVILHVVAEH